MSAHAVPGRSGVQLLAAWLSISLLALLWVYLGFGSTSVIREIIAVPVVLLIPGGLLVEVFQSCRYDPFLRLATSAGLSIAWCIVTGLLLDVLPGGIDRRSWACALGLVSVTEAVLAVTRRVRAEETWGSSIRSALARADARTAIVGAVAMLVTAGGLIGIVAGEGSNAEASYGQERFAELWVRTAPGGAVLAGVQSYTSGREQFRLSVSVGGRSIQTYAFALNRRQEWTHRVIIPPGSAERVLMTLFRGSSRRPSERVWYTPSAGS